MIEREVDGGNRTIDFGLYLVMFWCSGDRIEFWVAYSNPPWKSGSNEYPFSPFLCPFVKILITWPADVTVVKSTLLWLQKMYFSLKIILWPEKWPYVIELSWVLSWIPCLFWNWKNNWKIPETCRNIQSKAPAVGTGTSLEGLSHLLEVLVSGPDTLLEGRFERKNQLSLLDSVV